MVFAFGWHLKSLQKLQDEQFIVAKALAERKDRKFTSSARSKTLPRSSYQSQDCRKNHYFEICWEWLIDYCNSATGYDYFVQSDNGDNDDVDDNVDLPGNVDALPTEIGEPGLGDGGRWDHCTRPARSVVINAEKKMLRMKIDKNDTGHLSWRQWTLVLRESVCLHGPPLRSPSLFLN